jgi:hypothetical protein
MNLLACYDLEIERDRLGPTLDYIRPMAAASWRVDTAAIGLWHGNGWVAARSPRMDGDTALTCTKSQFQAVA